MRHSIKLTSPLYHIKRVLENLRKPGRLNQISNWHWVFTGQLQGLLERHRVGGGTWSVQRAMEPKASRQASAGKAGALCGVCSFPPPPALQCASPQIHHPTVQARSGRGRAPRPQAQVSLTHPHCEPLGFVQTVSRGEDVVLIQDGAPA